MKQPYELWMALRYVGSRGQDSFISFISLVSMVGVGLAVAVLIVVLSVMDGFQHELETRLLGIVSDATLVGVEPLTDWQAARSVALGEPDIVAAAPFVEGQGLVAAGQKLVGVDVRGVEPALESEVTDVGAFLKSGSLESLKAGDFRMLIGATLARELGVGIGDTVILAIAQGSVTPAGLMPRWKTFTVSGIFDVGMYEYDRGLVFVHMSDASLLFRTHGRASGLRLAVRNIYEAATDVRALAMVLNGKTGLEQNGGYYVSDWMRRHVNFFRSIALTKSIMFVLLSLVIGVAAFNIVSTLVMIVREKRGDIAILRTYGASSGSILGVFTSQGLLIGLCGIAFGVALGVALANELGAIVSWIESTFGIDLLAEDVYFLSDLPTQVRPVEVLHICLVTLALAFVATLYPAATAARLAPAESLRHE